MRKSTGLFTSNILHAENKNYRSYKEQPPTTPIYDIDVMTRVGCKELRSMSTTDRIVGHISLPHLRRNCVVVHVSGNCMKPMMNLLTAYSAINPHTDSHNILLGQIYVILMEDFRLAGYIL